MAVTSERNVRAITKQVRMSSQMSQSAVALEITSAHVSCVAAHMPLLRNTNSISLRPYYEPGTEPEVVHLHSVTSHVDSAVLWTNSKNRV